MIKPLLVGNWKMNGTLMANDALLSALADALSILPGAEVVVCPPFPYLAQALMLLKQSNVMVGAQNVSQHPDGAYTGEVSAAMLVDVGCQYVIVGHSERRQLFGETDVVVAEKTMTALNAGLTPIVCVGETLAEREAGEALRSISAQLSAVLGMVPDVLLSNMVLAYEPVWAIGTGRIPTLSDIEAVHRLMREMVFARSPQVRARILYGGSENTDNAGMLFSSPEIDGGLIGGASLSPDRFISLAQQLVYKKQNRI